MIWKTLVIFFLQTCCLLIFSCYLFHTPHSTGVMVLSIWIYSQQLQFLEIPHHSIHVEISVKLYCPMLFEKAFSVNGTTGLNLFCRYRGSKYLTNTSIFRLIHKMWKKTKCSKFHLNFIQSPPPFRNDVVQSLFSHSSSTGESSQTSIIWATCCAISTS